MSGKHTPGPWSVDRKTAHVNDVTGLPLCALQWPSDDRSEQETKANARLIAAAPDLLEALEKAERVIGTPDWETWATDEEIAEAWDAAQSAISKAKGGDA